MNGIVEPLKDLFVSLSYLYLIHTQCRNQMVKHQARISFGGDKENPLRNLMTPESLIEENEILQKKDKNKKKKSQKM